MKNALRLSFILGLVATLSTMALAGVNALTSPMIREQQAQRFRAAVAVAFPSSTSFKIIATEDDTYSPYLVEVLEIFEDSATIGFIYNKRVPGFGGPINYVMGVGLGGEFVSFDALSHSETPGFGARVFDEDEFHERLMASRAGQGVDALSGATNTSNAIFRGLDALYADFRTRMN